MNHTFQTLRAAVLTTAFLAISSTTAFGQIQAQPGSSANEQVKNAVAFEMTCTGSNCTDPTIYQGREFSIPKGYRLVITRIAAVTPGNKIFFEFVGTLNGQKVRHYFQFGSFTTTYTSSVTTHDCFVVLDSILPLPSSQIGGSGVSMTYGFYGYLVKL